MGAPRWSPDGRRILFASGLSDTAENPRRELYLVNADGSDLTRLTHNRVDDTDAEWSPDGTRIAFARAAADRPAYGSPGHRTGQIDLYTVLLHGRAVRRLTHTPEDERKPSWSPDGRRLAFIRDPPNSINVIDDAGRNERRLTTLTTYACLPCLDWAPRGELVAFGSTNAGGVVDATTRRVRRLTRGQDEWFAAQWSPDGRRLAYQLGKDVYSAKTIWLADLSNGRLRGLGYGWGDMTWSPDGRRIAFADRGRDEIYLIDVRTGGRTILETPLAQVP